jgi:hypothetical protein
MAVISSVRREPSSDRNPILRRRFWRAVRTTAPYRLHSRLVSSSNFLPRRQDGWFATVRRISEGWREALRQVGVSGALARDYEPAFECRN